MLLQPRQRKFCSIHIETLHESATKFRGAAHRNSNINIQLTKKVPAMFHNLRGYDSHLIFTELDKFDVKINVIPNGLEKYMAFF